MIFAALEILLCIKWLQQKKRFICKEGSLLAAAMATLKIETSGPFTRIHEDMYSFLDRNKRIIISD
jgi:hypothetical protein